MMKPSQKVYVADTALSRGIRDAVFVEPVENCKTAVRVAFFPLVPGNTSFMWLKHVHETREAAIADANGQRDRKITSLRKQIAKLEKVKFE